MQNLVYILDAIVFYDIIDKYNFSKAVDYSLNRRFDIGYVGWWYGSNYGSVLTNFALHEVLTKKLDLTVLMISFPSENNNNKELNTKSHRFARKHYDISLSRKLDDYGDLNYHCEKFVLGSDQLWNWYCIRGTKNHFLLDWVKKGKIKIAYSTSFGHSRSFFPVEERLEVASLLQEFDSVSVREQEGVDILRDDFGVSSEQTLDPVFLCDKVIYDSVANEVEPITSEEYIFAYILNPTEEKRNAIYYASKILKKRVVILIDGQAPNKEELSKIMGEKDVLLEVEIEQWLRLVKDAYFVITDSFHGACFSIINNKNFVAIKNQKRGNSRFESLFTELHLNDRLIDSPSEIESEEKIWLLEEPINYSEVCPILEKEIDRSFKWLKDALVKPKQPVKYHDLVRQKIELQEKRILELENFIKTLESKNQ